MHASKTHVSSSGREHVQSISEALRCGAAALCAHRQRPEHAKTHMVKQSTPRRRKISATWSRWEMYNVLEPNEVLARCKCCLLNRAQCHCPPQYNLSREKKNKQKRKQTQTTISRAGKTARNLKNTCSILWTGVPFRGVRVAGNPPENKRKSWGSEIQQLAELQRHRRGCGPRARSTWSRAAGLHT